MSYEIFEGKSIRRSRDPAITVLKVGRLGLNAAATEFIIRAGAEAVLLLFDRTNRRMALKPIKGTDDKRAYQVAFDKHSRGSGLNAGAFLNYAGVKYEKGSTSYPATWDPRGQMLEIELPESAFN